MVLNSQNDGKSMSYIITKLVNNGMFITINVKRYYSKIVFYIFIDSSTICTFIMFICEVPLSKSNGARSKPLAVEKQNSLHTEIINWLCRLSSIKLILKVHLQCFFNYGLPVQNIVSINSMLPVQNKNSISALEKDNI